MRIYKQRKINIKNCYILFISLVAIVSLIGNFFQDRFYNNALAVQEEMIEHFDNTNVSDNYN